MASVISAVTSSHTRPGAIVIANITLNARYGENIT